MTLLSTGWLVSQPGSPGFQRILTALNVFEAKFEEREIYVGATIREESKKNNY